MKKAKQVLSLILAASIIITVISVGIVSAGALKTEHSKYTFLLGDESAVGAESEVDTGADSKIYFEVPSFWKNFKDIRIYLYNADTGDVMIPWNSKKGRMTDEGDGKWSIDLAAKGHTFNDNENYACIFLTNDEAQTCDIFIGTPCFGDTAYCPGENRKIENALDPNKNSYVVAWKNADPNRYGVPLVITSSGNVVGTVLKPGQTKYDLFAAFLDKNAGTQGINNVMRLNPYKTAQQIIEEIAHALDLNTNDIEKAINEKGRSDLGWKNNINPEPTIYVYPENPASRAEELPSYSKNKIYFKAPSFWKNYSDIRIYLYNMDTGNVMTPWNSKKSRMTDEGRGIWSFDPAAKGYSFDDKQNYACIFLTNTEIQTCDIFIGNPCFGDTAYCTGENNKIENTVDFNKKSYVVAWKNADPNRYGVPLTITTIGNVVGSTLKPGQTKYDLFVAFLDKNAGAFGIDNAIRYNGKSVQQTIDDIAKALGLTLGDVKRAIEESGRSDLYWKESDSKLPRTNPTSIKLNRGTLGLGVGESYGLVKTISPANASQSISWSSSNTTIATVDKNGKVTGKKAGTVTVKAETINGKAALCTVTVKPAPTSVKINPDKLTLGCGETYTISESTSSGSYANAANLRWATTDSSIVSVTKTAGTNKAVLKANKAGTANVVITTYNNKIAICKVTVKPAPASVSTNPASLTLGKGESYTISESTSSGSYANAANLRWSTTDSSIVSVTKTAGTNKAVLKANKAGTASIIITTYNNKIAVCNVTVKPAPSSVSTNPASLTLGNGESYTISENTNSGSYANAANLKWSSSNTNVATVTKGSGNKATVKAVGTGTANITIKLYNGKTATCKVTVKPAPSSVKLSAASITLNKGKTYTISESTNSGSYANAANLKWTSTNTNVATVTKGSGNKATIKAVNKGTAYVKITLYNGKTAQCKVTVK